MNVTTPNVDTIICGDCLEEMKKLPDISRNSRREQAKIFCVEEILPDALDEIERLRAENAWLKSDREFQSEEQAARISDLEIDELIGFDLERARGLRDFLQDDCAEVGDVWGEMIAEIERLRASLIDLHAEYINTLEKNPECSAWDLDEQSIEDQRRLRKNAAHAISITEPPIYIQAEQLAAYIKELEADLEQAEICIQARLDVIDQQAARIKSLKKEIRRLKHESKVEQEFTNSYIKRLHDAEAKIKELEDAHKRSGAKYAKIINELRSSVYANIPGLDVGKIGPDAKPRSWQITEERIGLLEYCLETLLDAPDIEEIPGPGHSIEMLRAMLREAEQ